MIISRTPYRVSFFGGGTDYHTWYQQYGGAVLSTTIGHYCYLNCRFLPPFFEHKHRIVWTEIERVSSCSDIKHPAVRGILDYLGIERGLEISHQGDLPARSGLGSSSTFTVGLLNALYALGGGMSDKKHLACEAVHVERDILRENVGVQDQIAAAYGGFNRITIAPDGEFNVNPVILPPERLKNLQNHMMLFFTGVSRTASNIAAEKMKAIPDKKVELNEIREMVDTALDILMSDRDIEDFGRLLHESWLLKRSISSKIAPDFVDDIYTKARDAGAIGGKLLGAGGGGFMLFFVKPEDQPKLLDALDNLLLVPFEFETSGSQIVYYDPQVFSQSAFTRRDFMHLTDGSDTGNVESEKIIAINSNRKRKLAVVS